MNLMQMGLDAQAAALKAEQRRTPTVTVDSTLTINGEEFCLALQVWGRYHRAHPGQHDQGDTFGRLPRISPPEPAFFEVDRVAISDGHFVIDLDPVLPKDALDAIARAAIGAE